MCKPGRYLGKQKEMTWHFSTIFNRVYPFHLVYSTRKPGLFSTRKQKNDMSFLVTFQYFSAAFTAFIIGMRHVPRPGWVHSLGYPSFAP